MAVAMRGELAEQVVMHADRGCHLGAARAVRPRAQPGPLGWPYRGVLGQRSAGIILGNTESRVLRPLRVANQGRRQSRGRRLDRARLQPTQAPLIARYDLPRRVREPTHSDGTSRLTVCPPNGVKPSLRTRVTKGPGSRAAGIAMAYKLIDAAQARWRAVNAPHLVALVRAGAVFHKGKLLERPADITPPNPPTAGDHAAGTEVAKNAPIHRQ